MGGRDQCFPPALVTNPHPTPFGFNKENTFVKSMAFSPLSFLAGVGAIGLGLTLLGMSPVQGSRPGSRQGPSVPHPRDLVRILEGDPYVVPAGKILTIQTVTVAAAEIDAFAHQYLGSVKVNGQSVLSEVREYELGVTAQPGDTVTVEELVEAADAGRIGLALGYLTDI